MLIVFGGIALFNVHCSSNTNAEVPVYKNHAEGVQYVGMNTCKTCHSTIYETFIETGMGKSFGAASKEKSSGKFDEHSIIYDKELDFYYKPYFQNNVMYIMEYRLDGKDTIHKRIEKVDYIVGSGQHTNSHMYQSNGYFYQMPMTFYTQKQKWDLPPGFENGHNSRFSRTIELECMSCHNAYPSFVPGSKNKFASVLQGIDCERCHGPGELHVKEKQSGTIIDTANEIDYSIVNPKKLPYDLQVDLCQRCHLQGNAVLKEGKTFFDFKPGQKLSDYMDIFLPRYTGEKTFIMASHADRLKQSKCFIESNKQKINTNTKKYKNSIYDNTQNSSFTCISCHNPHVSVKVTGDAQFNNTCKSCHGNQAYASLPMCTEKLEARKITNDNCWKCHMPSSGTIDIPHVTVHDHKIQIPLKNKEKEEIKTFIGLAAINNPSPDNHVMGEAYLSYFEKFENNPSYLDSANYYLLKQGNYSPIHYYNNIIRLYYLQNNFTAVTQKALEKSDLFTKDAWTLYRIAESFDNTNNKEQALKYIKAAVESAPYILEFRNKLGAIALANKDIVLAKSSFEFIYKENPKFVSALSNLAFIYIQENNIQEAEKLIDNALALDPDYEQALFNKASIYMFKNDKNSAIKIIKRILKRNPQSEKAKQALMSLS
jgi:tetratricopeptide (TPR) repeat protein